MENNTSGDHFSHKDIHIAKKDLHEDQDIHDSPEDESKMQGESFTIDLPDVSDIPGQENITVPHIGEMADVTISSADEEGEGIFGDDDELDEDDIDNDNDDDTAVVTEEEKKLLQRADEDMPGTDDEELRKAELDNTDDDGELLNENSADVSGSDLDMAGTDEDDDMELIGEEDEENNAYSLGNDDNDNVTEGTP